MLDFSSPLINRLVKFWLPIVLLVVVAVYASQARYNAARETKLGFEHLNRWRKQAGLQPFTPSASLQKAAQNHARYLTKDADGHDERNRNNPHFTGATPQERATAVGYLANVTENLTLGSWARSGTENVNGLMTALYHRLTLLHPDDNEAGAAWVSGRFQTFVVVQGDSTRRELCEQSSHPTHARYILTLSCAGKPHQVHVNQPPRTQTMVVKFPIGRGIEPQYDGSEQPNPMPAYKETGNPITIAFHGEQAPVEMLSFQIFAPDGEVRQTKILTARTDPNRLLGAHEFALFPIEPLQWDTEYRVEFRYRQQQQNKMEQWTFRTRAKRHWFE